MLEIRVASTVVNFSEGIMGLVVHHLIYCLEKDIKRITKMNKKTQEEHKIIRNKKKTARKGSIDREHGQKNEKSYIFKFSRNIL